MMWSHVKPLGTMALPKSAGVKVSKVDLWSRGQLTPLAMGEATNDSLPPMTHITKICGKNNNFWHIPDAPCMEYLPTFTQKMTQM